VRLILSEDAEADLREISRYTKEHWGRERAYRYVQSLRNKLKLLCRHPELGPPAEGVRPALRRCSYVSHNVFYRIGSGEIRVVRILHKQMRAEGHLS
jgi:toxin ParE1/3/4